MAAPTTTDGQSRADPAGEPPAAAAPVLSSKIRSAALWSGLNSMALRLGQFFVGVTVARIIAPDQFGVFAVALTVQAIITNVNELGAGAALARTKRSVDEVAPTVATISIVCSALFTAAMFISAPQLSALLGAPQATGAVRILSLTVLIGGVTAVPYALLVRTFRQDKRFAADAANFVVSTAVVIALGVMGFGATALATSRVAGLLVSLALLYVMITPRYRPGWNRERAREILAYSLPLAGATLVSFTLYNADYMAVGHLRGALALGFYTLAYNISGWPVSVLGLMLNEVVLPAFAQAQDDLVGLARRVRGAFAITCAAALPVSAMILALARPLVTAVYGTRWSAAAAALAVLGLFGSMRILLTLVGNILAGLGRSRQLFLLQFVWIVALVPALIVGIRERGIVGAATAQEVVSIALILPFALWLIKRAGGGSPWMIMRACWVPAAGAVLAWLAAYTVAELVSDAWLALVLGGLAGLGAYVAVVWRWLRKQLEQARAHWNETGPGGVEQVTPSQARQAASSQA